MTSNKPSRSAGRRQTKKRSAPPAISERFGANLRRHRLNARMGQEKLALLAGLHRTEVSLLEHGRREPRIGTVLKLAGPLEISANDLLDGMAWQVEQTKPRDGAYYVLDRRVRD